MKARELGEISICYNALTYFKKHIFFTSLVRSNKTTNTENRRARSTFALHLINHHESGSHAQKARVRWCPGQRGNAENPVKLTAFKLQLPIYPILPCPALPCPVLPRPDPI